MHRVELNGVTFNYNSDMSGIMTIGYNGYTLNVPCEAILAFVAGYIRNQRITAIADASDEEIFGLPIKHVKV